MTRKIKSEARLAKLNKIITKALATTVSNEALNEITSSVISESLTNDEIAYTASELEDTITAILIEKVVKIKALQLNLKSNAEKGKVAVIDSSSELSHIKGLIIRDADKLQ